MLLKRKIYLPVLVSLRTMLTTPYVILIILSIATVGYISFVNGQAAVNNVARQLRHETALSIKQHLTTFLMVPHQINQANAYAIQNGELDLNNTDSMQQHFLNQVIIHTSITSMYFGSSEGGLVGSGREGAEDSLYVTITKDLHHGDFKKFAVNESGETISSIPLATVPNFDARTRPWYIGASQKKSEIWSDIYILFTGQDIAIAASRPVYDDDNNLLGVVSVDIFLSQLSKYLETLSISPVGQVFIMERSGALVATSTGEPLFEDENNNGAKERLYARDSQSAAIRQSDNLLIQTYGSYKNIPADEQQLEFMLDGEKQFLQFLSVHDPYGIDWVVVVIIPESAFMKQIDNGNNLTMWLIFATLITTVGTSIFVTSKITNRISLLDSSTQALASGEWDRELDANTHIAELNRLAISFNKMKEQLRHTLDIATTEVEERKRAEERTNQIANELQVILDTVTVGISHIRDRKVEWANATHDEMIGYPIGETRGLGTYNFYPNLESFQKLGQEAYPLISEGRMFSAEMEMRKRDGTLFWCSLTGRAISLKCPEDGAIWVLQDITERKQAEKALEEEILRRRMFFEESPDGILIIDPETSRFMEFNTAAHRQLGYTREEFAQLNIFDVETSETIKKTRAYIKNVTQTGRADFETLQLTREGEARYVHVIIQIINIKEKPIYYCIWRDITERKKLEQELQAQRDFATQIINAMGQGLTVTNSEGRFEFVNPAYAHLFGYETADLIGKYPQDVSIPEDHERLAKQRKLRINGKTTSYESSLQRADGSIAHVLVTGVPYKRDGEYDGAIAVITDLTEQKRIEEELRSTRDKLVILHSELEKSYELEQRLARIDTLTGINNRRSLFESAERELNVALRYQQALSVILFDVDRFKQINDTYGHLMGDQVLMRITQAVTAELRSVDAIGRYGGDEFIILLPRTSSQEAFLLAERIYKSVSAIQIEFEGKPISMSVSIGITQARLHAKCKYEATTDEQVDTVENIILRADKALYNAKQVGHNYTMIVNPE